MSDVCILPKAEIMIESGENRQDSGKELKPKC